MSEGRNEADRLRVILETLAFAEPELKLTDALPMVWEIEKKTLALESPEKALTEPDLTTPEGIAEWIEKPAQVKIRDYHYAGQGINAIKEIRARTLLGLKESKDGYDEWRRRYSLGGPF